MALAKVFGLVLMVVCFVALADAGPKDDDEDELDRPIPKLEEEEDFKGEEITVEEVITTIAGIIEPQNIPAQTDLGKWCSCKGLTCKCCLKIETKLINTELCTVFEYLPAENSAATYVMVRGGIVYKKYFRVSEPSRLCFGYKAVKICLEFYDIKVETKTFKACIRDSLYLFSRRIISYEFGCFTLNVPQSGGRPPLPKTTSKPKSKTNIKG